MDITTRQEVMYWFLNTSYWPSCKNKLMDVYCSCRAKLLRDGTMNLGLEFARFSHLSRALISSNRRKIGSIPLDTLYHFSVIIPVGWLLYFGIRSIHKLGY